MPNDVSRTASALTGPVGNRCARVRPAVARRGRNRGRIRRRHLRSQYLVRADVRYRRRNLTARPHSSMTIDSHASFSNSGSVDSPRAERGRIDLQKTQRRGVLWAAARMP